MSGATRRLKPLSYNQGAACEWLVANGLGGYASSTSIGANTRAYHGLLVAALHPPTNRMLLLSSLDEELIMDNGDRYMLSNHQYPGAIYPQGFRHLQGFMLHPIPNFSYKVGNGMVDKSIFMVHGENTTIVHYSISDISGRIRILPFITCRSFHAASDLPSMLQEEGANGTRISSVCDLFLLSDEARYVKDEMVYYNYEYEQERLRGLPFRENLLSPGYFEMELDGQTSLAISASTMRQAMPIAQRLEKLERKRLLDLEDTVAAPLKNLAQAADSFIVKRDMGKSRIAGYHWFDDWGRDAMISLPGLLLVPGRLLDAGHVLSTFADAMLDGLLPNDLGARSYNTADASLWFIQAAFSYFRCSRDKELIRRLWPKLIEVVERYSMDGPSIRMDSDSLIISGPALTWMDAQADGRPVTPRGGKACEINALWYGSLRAMEELARELVKPFGLDLSDRVRQSYQKFWNSENGCLFDVLDHEDASIRPNQIIAAAIPELLPELKRRRILEVVTRELLTPYGLRTLSPRDPRYCSRYEGGPRQRDEAYHQGTVWPWLIGPYIDALLSVNGSSSDSRAKAEEILSPLMLMGLDAGGICTIPEVFDGDAPHRAGGCISQAWSVAEVMRAWHIVQKGSHLGNKNCQVLSSL